MILVRAIYRMSLVSYHSSYCELWTIVGNKKSSTFAPELIRGFF